jgi:hypothetical protein
MATDARSVWVEVEYRRPFSGVPSVTWTEPLKIYITKGTEAGKLEHNHIA